MTSTSEYKDNYITLGNAVVEFEYSFEREEKKLMQKLVDRNQIVHRIDVSPVGVSVFYGDDDDMTTFVAYDVRIRYKLGEDVTLDMYPPDEKPSVKLKTDKMYLQFYLSGDTTCQHISTDMDGIEIGRQGGYEVLVMKQQGFSISAIGSNYLFFVKENEDADKN